MNAQPVLPFDYDQIDHRGGMARDIRRFGHRSTPSIKALPVLTAEQIEQILRFSQSINNYIESIQNRKLDSDILKAEIELVLQQERGLGAITESEELERIEPKAPTWFRFVFQVSTKWNEDLYATLNDRYDEIAKDTGKLTADLFYAWQVALAVYPFVAKWGKWITGSGVLAYVIKRWSGGA